MELSKDLLKKISEVVGHDINNPLTSDDIIYILESMSYELDKVQKDLDDLEADLRDNYRPISYKEQIGYNEKDYV